MNIIFDDIQPIRRARRSDPETSKAAARKAERFAASHSGRILAAMRGFMMIRADFIAHRAQLQLVQVDRRLHELEKAGFISVVKKDNGDDLVVDGYRVWKLCEKV